MNIKYKISKENLEEIKKARKNTNNKKEDRRLHAVELRALGYSNEEIVEIIQVNERTIIKWIQLYVTEGLQSILNKPRVGNNKNLTFEQEEELLERFQEKAEKGQQLTAQELKNEYIKMVGHSIGGSQIYRVLKRHGWRKVKPRSKHPKKASEEVIKASKKLTVWEKN